MSTPSSPDITDDVTVSPIFNVEKETRVIGTMKTVVPVSLTHEKCLFSCPPHTVIMSYADLRFWLSICVMDNFISREWIMMSSGSNDIWDEGRDLEPVYSSHGRQDCFLINVWIHIQRRTVSLKQILLFLFLRLWDYLWYTCWGIDNPNIIYQLSMVERKESIWIKI